MSYTIYGHDGLAGTSGTALTSHTPDSGGTWPTDAAHQAGGTGGVTNLQLDGNGMLFLAGPDSANIPSWTMPSTDNYEVLFTYKRLTALTANVVYVTLNTNLYGGSGTQMEIAFNEPTAAHPGIFFTSDGNTPLGSVASLPATGTLIYVRVRASTSGGNTTYSAASSTDGVTYTDMGISYTGTTPTSPIAIGPYMAERASGSWTATTGPHIGGTFVIEDLSATQVTISGASTGTVGTPSGTITLQTDRPAGYGGLSIPLATNVGGNTFSPASPATIAAGVSSATFTYTPNTPGASQITVGPTSPVLALSGSPWGFTASSATAGGASLLPAA